MTSRVIGNTPVRKATEALRTPCGPHGRPAWPGNIRRPAPAALPATSRHGAAAVFLPACINRMFGNARDEPKRPTLPDALVEVSRRAGLPVWIPEDVAGNCCATPWNSKGYARGNAFMAEKVADSLWRWSDAGRLPVVIDASSGAQGWLQDVPSQLDAERRERHSQLELVDSISWVHDRLLPRLEIRRRVGTAAVHPTCSAGHLRLTGKLEALVGALADEVFIPPGATCCGFAGGRAPLLPGFPPRARGGEAAELAERQCNAYVSSNRTCEVGLRQVTGKP